MKPRALRIRRGETTPYPSSKHDRELRAELPCSSRARSASPSVRTDSSSSGSKPARQPSSARQEPCTPSLEPHKTPAKAEPLRIGVETSLIQGYTLDCEMQPTPNPAPNRSHMLHRRGTPEFS